MTSIWQFIRFLRIVTFALVLFLLNLIASTVAVVALGVPKSSGDLVVGYTIGFIISVCVFAYMTSTNPFKPYLTAFVVGVLAMLFNLTASALVVGEVFWQPIQLVLDIPALLVAVIVGVSIGTKLNRGRGK